jgi:hypothetical protein
MLLPLTLDYWTRLAGDTWRSLRQMAKAIELSCMYA